MSEMNKETCAASQAFSMLFPELGSLIESFEQVNSATWYVTVKITENKKLYLVFRYDCPTDWALSTRLFKHY